MPKKHIVRLSSLEREECHRVIKRLDGKSHKVRRAYILLQCDADGPGWTDKQISEAYHCWTKTVENIRQRLVEHGFSNCLNGMRPSTPPRKALLDGEQEARIIATRLGQPPPGYNGWSLRLLAHRVVDLRIVDGISHETCRSLLKKTA